ncbi:MAG: SusC/RagA family TonB-linked outer membrane protein [Muribaculaceae bacterium]|nr:SusC/RagA family TonB-linked outer membrane protein [Muribaculaceae bacterium]
MKKLLLLFAAIMTLTLSGFAQNRQVSGTVVDSETDEPLVGATVMPIGGGVGDATNIDGHFTLNLPANVKELQISYVGYATQRVKISPDMTIKLDNNNRLSEVVVTGYGSAKKLGSVVGSVAVVGEQALENIPTATFVDALQGQVPGLSISSASGDPSSVNNSIRVRGVNSINASNTPLFILDGAPVTESVFTTLNPNDIEQITVLKDAASVAIYGSRAANGVIVITSKKGKMGERAKVTIRANYGWSQKATDKMKMMNSAEYLDLADKIGLPISTDMREAWTKYGIDTDWSKETFNSHAPTYKVEGTVQGGGENVSYYLSLGHYDAQGIITKSGMRSETLRVNLQARATDWFRVGFQGNLGYTKYDNNRYSDAIYQGGGVNTNNPMVFARQALPLDAPRYYTIDENGKLQYGDKALWLHYTDCPHPDLYTDLNPMSRNRVTLNLSLWEQINPVKGLTIRAQQNVDGYDQRMSNVGWPRSPYVTPMGDVITFGGSTSGWNQQSYGRYYAFTYTNTVEYTNLFNNLHEITVLLGQESIIKKSESFGAYATGYEDRRTWLLGQGTSPIDAGDVSQGISQETQNSFFVNAAYNYDSKYYIEATYRADGNSKFAPKKRWGHFYSFGAMWNMKAESFLAPVTWLDDLQFHVSYGTTGNSGIGNYGFYGLVGQMANYNGGSAWGISQPANPDLTWETVKQFDMGFNFGFWNILSGEVSFYLKNTVDLLMAIPYSMTTGFASGAGNIGSMRNTGIDLNLKAEIFKTKDWYWALRGNFNYNSNKITELFDGQDELTLAGAGIQYKVGHSMGELYSVRWAGIDSRDGKTMWLDRNGNLTKVYNEEDNAVLTGMSMYAPWSGGFGTDVRWKGLTLRVDFNWAADKYMLNNDRYFIENANFANQFNQLKVMNTIWTKPGDVTNIAKAGEVLQFDTHLIENASYMRLKNLTLQYNFPQEWLSKIYLQNLSVHFTGRNLLTFTNYTGTDPEPETNVIAFFYPNTRQYEFGIEVTF